MENNSEIKSNNIIFECMVSLKNDKYDTLLSLTEKNLLLKKKKGLFHKTYKVINDILIEDIKVVNEKVKINQNKNRVTIYTQNDEIYFTCENVTDTKKLIENINKLVLGEDFLERTTKRGVKLMDTTKKIAETIGVVAVSTVGVIKAIKENKGVLKNTIKTITNFIKK